MSNVQPRSSAQANGANWQIGVYIAWICVLEKEYQAAVSILDERYDDTQVEIINANGDENLYCAGRIGVHDIVINCPAASAGHYTAQGIARDIKATFPCIQYAMLVGIGGGAPNLEKRVDVRLGDVVVSKLVIPYQSGKLRDNGFEITASPIDPSKLLMGCAIDYRADLATGKESLKERMEETVREMSRAMPRPSGDDLFKTELQHLDEHCDCLKQATPDSGKTVPRAPRSERDLVRLHIGIVGSADQVLRNAKERDRLSEEKGIICFEMEAAVVMRSIPSITIRGISDYCDGHKNDRWHDYATLSAAVCAKQLLKRIKPGMINGGKLYVSADDLERLLIATILKVQRDMARANNGHIITNAGLKTMQRRLDVLLYFVKLQEGSPKLPNASDIECLKRLQENLMVYFDNLYIKVMQRADIDQKEHWQVLLIEVKQAAQKVWQLRKLVDSMPELYNFSTGIAEGSYDYNTEPGDDTEGEQDSDEWNNNRTRQVEHVITKCNFAFKHTH